jgi:hypothetical protein
LDRRLGGPQSWSGCGDEEENSQLYWDLNPQSSGLYPSFIPLSYSGSQIFHIKPLNSLVVIKSETKTSLIL